MFYRAAFIYDKAGNMTTRYVGDNWVTTDASQRDPLNRISHLEHRLAGATRTLDYQFNWVSNRTSIQRDGATPEAQAYDATQELTQTVENGNTVTLSYDNNGNRKSPNGDNSYVSNNLNQYTVFNGVGVDYDGNGNLASYNGILAGLKEEGKASELSIDTASMFLSSRNDSPSADRTAACDLCHQSHCKN